MKFMAHTTAAIRLLGTIMSALAAGIALTTSIRKLVREVAEDEGLVERLVAAQKEKQ